MNTEEQSQNYSNLKNLDDFFAENGIIQNLVKSTVETILKGELEDQARAIHSDKRKVYLKIEEMGPIKSP